MYDLTEYPIFNPPLVVPRTLPSDWTDKQALEYFDWLLDVANQRVTNIQSFFDCHIDRCPSNWLLNIGGHATDLLLHDSHATNTDKGEIVLSGSGYSMIADLGLLIASVLLQKFPNQLAWHLVNKPVTDLHYNLPVISGFKVSYFDPIGSSIAEAYGILRGDRDSTIWQDIFCYWESMVIADKPKV